MSVEQVRSEILRQHEDMKRALPGIEAMAKSFEGDPPDAQKVGAQLRDAGLALYEMFRLHLDREQELLEPLLLGAGERGERFLRRLAHEHREQRELLEYLLGRLEGATQPSLLIARELQNFAGFLRLEMAHEEETLLAPDLVGGAGK